MSLSWEVPIHGSLVTRLSPGERVSGGNVRRKWPTAVASEPMNDGRPCVGWLPLEALDAVADPLAGVGVEDPAGEGVELPPDLAGRHGIERVAAGALDPLRLAGAVLPDEIHPARPLLRERGRDALVDDDLDLPHDGADPGRLEV